MVRAVPPPRLPAAKQDEGHIFSRCNSGRSRPSRSCTPRPRCCCCLRRCLLLSKTEVGCHFTGRGSKKFTLGAIHFTERGSKTQFTPAAILRTSACYFQLLCRACWCCGRGRRLGGCFTRGEGRNWSCSGFRRWLGCRNKDTEFVAGVAEERRRWQHAN